MFKCDDCTKEFKKSGGLERHAAKVHNITRVAEAETNGRAPRREKKPSRAKREAVADECTICEEAAVARLVVPDTLDWKLCDAHLKVTIRFVEPL